MGTWTEFFVYWGLLLGTTTLFLAPAVVMLVMRLMREDDDDEGGDPLAVLPPAEPVEAPASPLSPEGGLVP